MVKKCIALVKLAVAKMQLDQSGRGKLLLYGLKQVSILLSYGICYCGGNVDNGMVSDLSR